MLIEALSDYPSPWSAIQAIASKIGCTAETLLFWHEKYIEQTTPASVQAQSKEQPIKELRQANEIIHKAADFIIDVFARRIVSWKVFNRMNTDMMMAALNQAIIDRNKPKDAIHYSDIGVHTYLFAIPIEWLRLVLSLLWARLVIHTTMHWLKRLTGFIRLK